jgi:hypothetical protein
MSAAPPIAQTRSPIDASQTTALFDLTAGIAAAGAGMMTVGAAAAASLAWRCASLCALGIVSAGSVIAISTSGSGAAVSWRAGTDFGPP